MRRDPADMIRRETMPTRRTNDLWVQRMTIRKQGHGVLHVLGQIESLFQHPAYRGTLVRSVTGKEIFLKLVLNLCLLGIAHDFFQQQSTY
jgi:hypothetical protein